MTTSEAQKALWQDPTYRQRSIEARKQAWADPQYRQKMSDIHRGRIRDREAAGFWIQDGYRFLSGAIGHPLADIHDTVAEHRKVLYDEVGPGPHQCYWGCGKTLEWGGKRGIYVDHLDDNPLNNDLLNLVVSCISCNLLRAHWKHPLSWRHPNERKQTREMPDGR